MKEQRWQVYFGMALVALSAVLYGLHYLLFHDAHHIFIYLVGDIAFVPVEVLLVTLVIHQLLKRREKRAVMQKLNMAIGVFFSEIGTSLLGRFMVFDTDIETRKRELVVDNDWSAGRSAALIKKYGAHDPGVDCKTGDLDALKDFLVSRRPFLSGLLANPSLLEHESFTDLLWAVLHLAEELGKRDDLTRKAGADSAHLAGDIKRAYSLLITQWLAYMCHLKEDYPYLFSLALRTNPFDENAKVELA